MYQLYQTFNSLKQIHFKIEYFSSIFSPTLPRPQMEWFSFKLVMEIKTFMIMIKQKLRWKAWQMGSSDSF